MLITKEVLFEFPNKWISHTLKLYKETDPQDLVVTVADVYFWNNKYYMVYCPEICRVPFMIKYCVISESEEQERDISFILNFEQPPSSRFYNWTVVDSSLQFTIDIDYTEEGHDVILEQIEPKIYCIFSTDLYPNAHHKKLFIRNIDNDSRQLILIGSTTGNSVGIGKETCLVPIRLKKVKALLIRDKKKKEIELPVRYLDIQGDSSQYTEKVNFIMDQNNLFLLGYTKDFKRRSLIAHCFPLSKLIRCRNRLIPSEYFISQPITPIPFATCRHYHLDEGMIEYLVLHQPQTIISIRSFIKPK